MVPGTQKELFLKNLDTLFYGYRGIFNSGNKIIVDDSPLKHIMNRPENVLLPNPWSNRGNGDCRSTKTQINPISAFNRTKHHQSDLSNVLGILGSNSPQRACVHTSKSSLL